MVNEAAMVRCVIYTRKSTEEGLEQAFNSLFRQSSLAPQGLFEPRFSRPLTPVGASLIGSGLTNCCH